MKISHYIVKLRSIIGLGYQLAKANFKLKNEGSFLGIFWYLLEPFLLFLVILLIRDVFSFGTIDNYPLYLLLGLIMFNFFTGVTSKATTLVSGNTNFIKSVKLNHESLVVSRVAEGMFTHFFEFVLFVGFMVYFGANLVWVLFYPIIFVFFVFFTLGLSFILATVGVFVNDLNNVWRVIMRILFFATPLFYILEPGSFIYKFNLINPLFYFISIARDFIIYNEFSSYWMMSISSAISCFMLVFGVIIFDKYKDRFAEFV